MKAAVLHAPRDLRIESVAEPKLDAGEVLIKVEASGICGSDVHVYEGTLASKLPVIPGHEFAGVVAESRSDQIKPGTRIFAQGSWGCGQCEWCARGLGARCKGRRALGRNIDGTFAEYAKVPGSAVYPLPDGVRMEQAQSLVTISCAINAVKRARGDAGADAIVIGPGHAGLLIMQTLKASGYGKVAVIGGTRRYRLKVALELGADLAALATDAELEEKLAEALPQGASVVVEASGSLRGLDLALKLVKVGGTVVAFGMFGEAIERFDPNIFYNKELAIVGAKGAGNYYSEALNLLQTGEVKVSPLVTHRLPLSRTDEGFKLMTTGDPEAMRIVINPWS